MRSLLSILLVGAIVVAGAVWVNGQREFASLRESNAALTRQFAGASGSPTTTAATSERSTPSGLSLEEQTELLRLRGEIQPLRRQVRDLSNQVASAAKPVVPIAR